MIVYRKNSTKWRAKTKRTESLCQSPLPLHSKLLKACSIGATQRPAVSSRAFLTEKTAQNLTDNLTVKHKKPFTIEK